MVVLLPFATPGNFTVFLDFKSFDFGGDAGSADNLAEFPIVSFASPPTILSVAPSQAPAVSPGSAGIVELWVSGFPPPMVGATVAFGGVTSTVVGGPQPDGRGGVFLSVRAPADAVPGLTNVTITYQALNSAGQLEVLESAGRPFLILSDRAVVHCSAGCKLRAAVGAGELQNLTLEVEFRPGQAMLDPALLEVGCIARLDSRPTGASDCKIESFSAAAAACAAVALDGVTCLRIEALVAVNSSAALTTPAAAGFIYIDACGCNSSCSFQLAATVEFRRPPRLAAASFSSCFGRLELEFDGPTAAVELPCAALVRAAAYPIGGFGSSPTCGWVNPTRLEIALGPGATLAAGDVIEVSAIASTSADAGAADPASDGAWGQGVAVAGPDRPQLPRVWLSGPAEVPACDTADLFASVSGAPGARFEWGCVDDATLDAHLRNRTAGPTATVPGALLAPGRTYRVSVLARPRFGLPSAVALHVLAHAPTPRPRLAISRPPPPLTRSRGLLLQAVVALSVCATAPPASPVYLWTIEQAADSPAQGQQVLRGSGPVLAVPAGLLSVGVLYSITLDAVFPASTSFPVRATADLALESEPVAARLAGGDRTVHAGAVVALDASFSFDPDTCTYAADPAAGGQTCTSAAADADAAASGNGQLVFEWTCTAAGGSPCRYAVDGAVASLGVGSTALLDLKSLKPLPTLPAEIRIVVAVRRRTTNTSREQGLAVLAGVTLLVAEEAALDVGFTLKYMTATRAVFTSDQPTTTDSTVAWTVVSAAGAAVASSPNDLKSFPAGTAGRTFVMQLAADSLLAARGCATEYRITMSAAVRGSNGVAISVLSPPRPPSGGACATDPPAGIALFTRFEVRCWDWASDSLPIAYSASARLNSTRSSSASVAAALASQEASQWDLEVSWSYPGPDPVIGLFLFAPGNYTIAAAVTDAAGARAIVSTAGGRVHVKASPGGRAAKTDATAVVMLTDQLMQVGAVSSTIALLDNVAEHLNYATAAATAAASTAGRRLLASSSAVYRTGLRRMLLRQLAGIADITPASAVAPAILRAAWRAAAVSAEIDDGGIKAGAVTLAAALGRLDVGDLRATSALRDAIALAAAVLQAAVPSADAADAAALQYGTAAAILRAAKAIAAGMVDGEAPLIMEPPGGGIILHAARGALAPLAGVSANWTYLTVLDDNRRDLLRTAESLPKGLCVVRLDPLARAPLPPAAVVASSAVYATPFPEVVGVRVMPADRNSAAEGRWSCAAGKSGCVRVTVGVDWRYGPLPPTESYSCMLWIAADDVISAGSAAASGANTGQWSSAGCAVESAAWVQRPTAKDAGGGASAAVVCKCNTDGIITAAAAPAQLPLPEPAAPKWGTVFHRTHETSAALTIIATAATIVAGATTFIHVQCRYLRAAERQAAELRALDYPEAIESKDPEPNLGTLRTSLWPALSCSTVQPMLMLKPHSPRVHREPKLSSILYSRANQDLTSLTSWTGDGASSAVAEHMSEPLINKACAGMLASADLVYDLGCGRSTPVWPSLRQRSCAAALAVAASMAAASAASAALAAEAASAAAVSAANAALAAAGAVSRRANDRLVGNNCGQPQQPTRTKQQEWHRHAAEEETVVAEWAEVVSAGDCDEVDTNGLDTSCFEFLEPAGGNWLPAGASLRAILTPPALEGLIDLAESESESESEPESDSGFKLDSAVLYPPLPIQRPPWNDARTAHGVVWPLGLLKIAISPRAAVLATGGCFGCEASSEAAGVTDAADG
jgi:hypothetical protein